MRFHARCCPSDAEITEANRQTRLHLAFRRHAACGVHPGARPWSRDVDEWRVRSVRLWPVASRRCSSCIACLDAGYGPGKETA